MRTIDGHTYDNDLLSKSNGWIIDAGARGFNFSDEMLSYGREVYSLDIEKFDTEYRACFVFKHAALMAKSGNVEAHYFGNGTANFIKGLNEQPYNGPDRPCETKAVKAITLQDIYAEIGTDIDLLKLDIEAAEYEILANIEPIPKQITVEFHEHSNPVLHKKWINHVLTHLGKHYYFNLYVREWPLYLFMDCLFIRKDLL